jgi:hypothetical protein
MEELHRIEKEIPGYFHSAYVEYGPDGLPDNNIETIRVFRVHDYLYTHDVEDYDKHLADQLLQTCMRSLGFKSLADKMFAALANHGHKYYRKVKPTKGVVDMPIVGMCRNEDVDTFMGMMWKFLLSLILLLGFVRVFKKN